VTHTSLVCRCQIN